MVSRRLEFDKDELDKKGYVVFDKVVSQDRLRSFETAIEQFSVSELQRRGVKRTRRDALQDLMLSDNDYREALFPMLKYLRIVQLMSAEVGNLLTEAGLLDALGFETPLIWPSLRVDLPRESTYLLPMHQDFRSTKCSRSFRLWIPLRAANRYNGTIRLVPGSHRHGPLPHDADDSMLGRKVGERFYQREAEHTLELKAGNGLLFNPLLVHGSVGGEGELLKYVLLVQIQDLSTFHYHPSDVSAASQGASSA